MQDSTKDHPPAHGVARTMSAGVRRIIAPNPSPMTYWGTNTFLLGTRDLAVIDPGPANPAHLDAIMAALLPDQSITHILVTHAHLDHSPLAKDLSDLTGAPVYGFGPARAGRSPIMQQLADTGNVGGGEGVDTMFDPDICLQHGDVLSGSDWTVKALHTPGHMANHLSFACGDVLFTGDLVMGWASSLVSPPDGDLTAFMASLEMLQQHSWSVFHPGHGDPVPEPHARLHELLTHRRARDSAIRQALALGPNDAAGLARMIYTDTPKALLPAATRNVLAHLIDLAEKSVVSPVGTLSEKSVFELVS